MRQDSKRGQGLRARVNGERRELEAGTTVARLVAELVRDAPPDGFAVAVNGEVVPRAEWQERKVQDEDIVEVVRAVAGG